ncbi:MAG TPA: ABC transporter permease [Spirochaetota bacterium]|nr:ABC transporter permease [Spirochaetota bacterium]
MKDSMNNSSILVVEAGKTEKNYWIDLWKYRELFLFLSLRDILVRYKQTIIGLIWSIIRPLITMIIFTVVFGKLAKFPSGDIPYPIFVFSALLGWQFFANSLNDVSNSLIANSNIISKIYFPRIIIPTSSVIVNFIDFSISLIILLILFIIYGFTPKLTILFLPFFVLMTFSLSLGIGLVMSSLNVKYRDFRYVVPFLIQIGLYISPVGFTSSIVPEKFRILYSLNPMVGVIEGYRYSLTGVNNINIHGLIISVVMTLLFLIIGITYFRKTEKKFADVI